MADYQQHLAELAALGVKVVALSADSEPDAAALVQRLGLKFTIAAVPDPEPVARALGCYTGKREGRPHLQPTEFVLAPDGTIVHAVYSSGNVGRLSAEDALTVVRGQLKKD